MIMSWSRDHMACVRDHPRTLLVTEMEEALAHADGVLMNLLPKIRHQFRTHQSLGTLLTMFGTPPPPSDVPAVEALGDNAELNSPGTEKPTVCTKQVAHVVGNQPMTTLPVIPPCGTSLIIRNISAKYTTETLLKEWVPDATFDLLHMPYDHVHKRMAGYAFMNFVTHEHACAFQRRWHKKQLVMACKSRKRLHVMAAPVQGYHVTLAYLKGQSLRHHSPLPALFAGTWRLDSQSEYNRIPEQRARNKSRW